jgi:two-component system, OmpR family, sensor kinase
MMRSLRIRLILLLGLAIMLAAMVQFVATFRVSMSKADTLFDYHMQQMALALRDSAIQQTEWYSAGNEQAANFDFVVQVWTDDGARVYQSRSYRMLPARGKLGYSNVTLGNGEWRIYAVHDNTRVIQVAQKMETRRARAASLAANSVWPILLVSLLLIGAVWWVVTVALAPLNRIGHDLAHRNADSLDPVSDAGVPKEVSRLLKELNSLLRRMAQALQSQQRFVADAAHELRSPLTALKLQVQTLARARDEQACAQAIVRLSGGVDRASRMVEQLLSLARQDPLADAGVRHDVALSACVESAVGDIMPLASARAIDIECDCVTPVSVRGDEDGLRILVRNLLDNAVRYTPENGKVRIALSTGAGAGSAVLTVEDSGPGIPPESRSRVFDRFYRLSGTEPTGTGLGLAIVKAAAERHGAVITLDASSLGGLRVEVAFPFGTAVAA